MPAAASGSSAKVSKQVMILVTEAETCYMQVSSDTTELGKGGRKMLLYTMVSGFEADKRLCIGSSYKMPKYRGTGVGKGVQNRNLERRHMSCAHSRGWMEALGPLHVWR